MNKTARGVVPVLQMGSIGEKPRDIEFFQRGSQKWYSTIETLKILESTQCIQIDITDMDKKEINSIRQGIRNTGVALKFKPVIKLAVKDKVLYVWSNR